MVPARLRHGTNLLDPSRFRRNTVQLFGSNRKFNCGGNFQRLLRGQPDCWSRHVETRHAARRRHGLQYLEGILARLGTEIQTETPAEHTAYRSIGSTWIQSARCPNPGECRESGSRKGSAASELFCLFKEIALARNLLIRRRMADRKETGLSRTQSIPQSQAVRHAVKYSSARPALLL